MTVSEKLRLVQGLHSHAEMFGFNWNDGSDWTWHDVACKVADEIDAENAKLREDNDRLIQAVEDLHDVKLEDKLVQLENENDKLRELVRGLHMAYAGALNECESLDEGLIWKYSGSIEADVAKSRARFEADRHRFDTALRDLGIEES